MLNVTEILSEEHENILSVINSVLKECSRLEEGKALDHAFFGKVIDFIKNYADGFHHAKEEDILFAELLDNVDRMHCNPIPVMFHEHEAGRNYVRAMEEGLERNDKEHVIENARGYCYLLQEHIYKEDNILFQMAEEALNDEQKQEVLKKYQEVEATRFTPEKLKKYLSIV
jgi:hemerythrin-like domain-containing protein